jgi:battenin
MRNVIAFWLLGLVNNMAYVIMMAGANDIASGGVGLVYFFDVFPSLMIQITAPYWFQYISYRDRTILGALCMTTSFLLVALGDGSLLLQLIGVFFGGLQSGIGEATFLGLASFYHSRKCLTAWASGTGLAGLAGYAWKTIFNVVFGLSFSGTLLSACIFPIVYIFLFVEVLETSHLPVPQTKWYGNLHDQRKEIGESHHALIAPPFKEQLEANQLEKPIEFSGLASLSAGEKRRLTCTLWPYMIPLCVVYFAEYTMMTGVWSTIGFPSTSSDARGRFYLFSGFAYQAGVFVSRSSGMLFQATRPILWLMPTLQSALLVLFTLIAMYQFWYNWWLLVLCFIAGLLGGCVYVNAYTLISKELPPEHVEFALTTTCLSNTLGIIFADVAGIFLQGCLYSYLHIPGAAFHISC